MQALMRDQPLLISSMREHALRVLPRAGTLAWHTLLQSHYNACGKGKLRAQARQGRPLCGVALLLTDEDGCFASGDIANIDGDGDLIADRARDVVRAGGACGSSIALGNAAMGHPAVAAAARDGSSPTRDEVLGYLASRVAKWRLPDDVVFVSELPYSANGKVQKMKLREKFKQLNKSV